MLDALKAKGIAIRVASPKLVMEEAPESYKVCRMTRRCYTCMPLLPWCLPLLPLLRLALVLATALDLLMLSSTVRRYMSVTRYASALKAPALYLPLTGRERGGGHLPRGGHQPEDGQAAAHCSGQGLSAGRCRTTAWKERQQQQE